MRHKNTIFILLTFFLYGLTAPAYSQLVPEVLYYRFKYNTTGHTPNYAYPGSGSNPATVIGNTFTSGGQFDTCMTGIGGTGSTAYINTGWTTNLGASHWTISLWVKNLAEVSSGIALYLFGDNTAGNFRCFYGGAGGPNNVLLRADACADVLITDVMPGPTVIHFVYDAPNLSVYKNGTLYGSYLRPGFNVTGTSTFKVGGYSSSQYSLNSGGKIDEFRVYNRSLTPEEVSITWNVELPIYGSLGNSMFCRTSVNKPILNNQFTYDTIYVNLPPNSRVVSMRVKIDTLFHTNDADLSFYLSHLNRGVNFIKHAGGSGDNFLNTTIIDTASCPIGSSACNTAPFIGYFKPTTPAQLSVFSNLSTNGFWVLAISDTAVPNTGTLESWCILISYDYLLGTNGQPNAEPTNFALMQNYPNPFNPSTKIIYYLPLWEKVKLTVYDVLGRQVKELVNDNQPAGSYTVEFNGADLTSGVYFYKLEAGSFVQTKKMTLIK
jgi:hypothetical protein